MAGLFIGLMSGTSADAIDAALLRFQPRLHVLATRSTPLSAKVQQRILAIHADSPLRAVAELDILLGRLFAQAALELLAAAGVRPEDVTAIGSHGQTVWHAPDGTVPFTLQLGDPNVIAELTGITTVADFRRRDVAAGGQGAPLVPAFHREIFAGAGDCCVLNLGGIANITVLAGDATLGFDVGPANTLLDGWIRQHLGRRFDADGAWAASGAVLPELLEALLEDPYFARPPPKSTGPEHFSLAWLERHLHGRAYRAQDVQATLLELTARSIATAVRRHAHTARQLLVCGGGVHNRALMTRLQDLLAPLPVRSTAELGVDPDFVEACAFAWLARQRLLERPGNVPEVTGASAPVILGGIYGKRVEAGLDREG
ncbi:MAG: anhydro-N-acetylmuramic acid kinase [Xanthomonadaceae bacterium]|nr:anhydro-N-acetylmuramic acid kinase [Xanthomonadaceae bacterium]